MDWEQIERNWKQARQKIQQKWIRLSPQDLNAIKGRRDRLEDSIHKRYGFDPDHIRKEVDDWLRWQG
jgi:uncharacterized protein YjbJ (UPF0337 family)